MEKQYFILKILSHDVLLCLTSNLLAALDHFVYFWENCINSFEVKQDKIVSLLRGRHHKRQEPSSYDFKFQNQFLLLYQQDLFFQPTSNSFVSLQESIDD